MKKPAQRAKRPPRSRAGKTSLREGKEAVTVAAQAPDKAEQARVFEQAVELFHAGGLRAAKELFLRVDAGPDRVMAHRARVHAQVCDRRLAKAEPELTSPEDHYNYAVTLINSRDLANAEWHLRRALERKADGDHVHYALALCCGLQGDFEQASAHLRRAIELQPRNRVAARNDPDFQGIVNQPLLRRVLYLERTDFA